MPARILVNSKLRSTVGANSASNFRINTLFQTPIVQLRFVDVIIPFSWLPIDSTNNTIIFNEGAGANITATIATPATWSASDIATALQTTLNTSGTQLYTVTFNVATNNLTISAPGAFSLKFATLIAAQPFNTLNQILGFTPINTISAITITGDFMMQPGGPNYILLAMPKAIQQTRDSDTYLYLGTSGVNSQLSDGYSIFIKIPLIDANGPGSTIFYGQFNNDRIIEFSGRGMNPNYLDFELLNPWTMQPLSLRNDWALELEICTLPIGGGKIKNIGI